MSATTTQQVSYSPGIAFATTRAGAERRAREAATAAANTRSTRSLVGRLFSRHAG